MSGAALAVTGATSFLGRNLIGLLEEDERIARVLALDVMAAGQPGRKTTGRSVDLTLSTAEDRLVEVLEEQSVDTIVHLAFLASPSHATAWAHELESVGTMHVLNAARRAGVRKLVLRSNTLL